MCYSKNMSHLSRLFLLELFLIFLSCLFTLPVYAKSSLELSNPSVSQLQDATQSYDVSVRLNMENSEGKIYYLRGVFHKAESSNYCGFTWNGSTWFKGPYTVNDGWKSFPSVTISSSSAVIQLSARIDPEDSGCKETGSYRFKIQRFTEGGSGTFDDQNEQEISVVIPTLTTVPTLTPKSQNPTSTRVPSSMKPTLTPSLEKKVSSTPAKSVRPIPSQVEQKRIVSSTAAFSDETRILGEVTGSGEKSRVNVLESSMSAAGALPQFFIFLGIGCIFLGVAGGISILKMKGKQLSDLFP